jgi:hypothetical protein
MPLGRASDVTLLWCYTQMHRSQVELRASRISSSSSIHHAVSRSLAPRMYRREESHVRGQLDANLRYAASLQGNGLRRVRHLRGVFLLQNTAGWSTAGDRSRCTDVECGRCCSPSWSLLPTHIVAISPLWICQLENEHFDLAKIRSTLPK